MEERTNFFELNIFFQQYQQNIDSNLLKPVTIPFPPYSLKWSIVDKNKFINIPWVVKEVKLK